MIATSLELPASMSGHYAELLRGLAAAGIVSIKIPCQASELTKQHLPDLIEFLLAENDNLIELLNSGDCSIFDEANLRDTRRLLAWAERQQEVAA